MPFTKVTPMAWVRGEKMCQGHELLRDCGEFNIYLYDGRRKKWGNCRRWFVGELCGCQVVAVDIPYGLLGEFRFFSIVVLVAAHVLEGVFVCPLA